MDAFCHFRYVNVLHFTVFFIVSMHISCYDWSWHYQNNIWNCL